MTANKNLAGDVIVLGSGLAGSIAALCLVRQGLRVIIVERATHPRFALGESTTTPSSLWLRVLAERFGAPELLHLASSEALLRHVSPSSGIKNNFGFLYHRAGAARPERVWQAVIPPAFLTDTSADAQPAQNEMHYFRQDVDAWLWATALAAGAVGLSGVEVADVVFDDAGATVRTTQGRELRGRFVVDASGERSPIARQLGLRCEPPPLRTDSRCVFTHMVAVRPYEQTGLVPDSMARWSQGTLHHFFDGGWVWVIPFDNHRSASNRLCSVGLSLDNRRHPIPAHGDADDEWAAFLHEHPAIAAQFVDAKPVRPWTRTQRLQYASSASVGDRFWLTSHAAGTVDALFSMGNINTFQMLANALDRIVAMCADDDFRRQRLQPVQELGDALLAFQDRIVYGNYVGSRDPRLLQTWISLWSLTDTARIRSVLIPLVRYVRTRDRRELDACLGDPNAALTGVGMRTGITDTTTVLADLAALCDVMAELDADRATVEQTVQRLEDAVRAKPQYGIDLGAMAHVFERMPWDLAPLSHNGLRAYGNCFLDHGENHRLGLAGDDGRAC